MILSDIFVDSRKAVTNDLLLQVPSIGWNADFSLDIDFRNVDRDRMLEADLRRLVLVNLYVSAALSKIGGDEVSND